jgi:hypothetical protein
MRQAELYFRHMDLNNKHRAVLAMGVLIGIFVLIALWYMAGHPAPETFIPQTAQAPTRNVAPTGPQHIAEHAKYYDIDVQYPLSTPLAKSPGPTADSGAVAAMKDFLVRDIAQFKSNGNFGNLTPNDIHVQGLDQGRMYSLQGAYKTYQGTHTVSYVYILSEDTLGAHPNTYYHVFTFDTATGAQLSLSDLFASKDSYLQLLSTTTRADLPKIVSDMSKTSADTDYISRGTTPTVENFQNWYVDGSNLVLIFPPYQVGPYSLGTVLDPIPLTKLSKSLVAEFRP